MSKPGSHDIEAILRERWKALELKVKINLKERVDNYVWQAMLEDDDSYGETLAWHRRQNAEDQLLEALEMIIRP